MSVTKKINGYDIKDYELDTLQVTENQGKYVKINTSNLLEVVNITKSTVDLANVDNTSDATKKSNFTGAIADGNTGFTTGTAVYQALAGKSDTTHTHNYAASDEVGGAATTTVSAADTTTTTVYVTGVAAANGALKYNTNIYMNCSTGVLMGAAWNDFAECRDCQEEAGTCVVENGDGKLYISNDYCQLGCSIVSDTYGMLIGAKEYENGAPIAVAGRVLAKFDYSKGDPVPGFPVCSAPNGRVALMDRNQVRNWPDAIVGYISEIPTYEEWNGRKVNNRIWIKVK